MELNFRGIHEQETQVLFGGIQSESRPRRTATRQNHRQGQGTFSMEFAKYNREPSAIQQAIIKERKR